MSYLVNKTCPAWIPIFHSLLCRGLLSCHASPSIPKPCQWILANFLPQQGCLVRSCLSGIVWCKLVGIATAIHQQAHSGLMTPDPFVIPFSGFFLQTVWSRCRLCFLEVCNSRRHTLALRQQVLEHLWTEQRTLLSIDTMFSAPRMRFHPPLIFSKNTCSIAKSITNPSLSPLKGWSFEVTRYSFLATNAMSKSWKWILMRKVDFSPVCRFSKRMKAGWHITNSSLLLPSYAGPIISMHPHSPVIEALNSAGSVIISFLLHSLSLFNPWKNVAPDISR